jgi:hypothetical protein
MLKYTLYTLTALLWFSAAQAQTPVSISPNSWASGSPMPTSREAAFVGVIGTKIYVVGGASSTAPLSVNEIYDTATNS